MKRRAQKNLAKLSALLLVLMLVPMLALTGFAAETETAEPVCYDHGDVNNDGSVDSRDAIYTLYHTVMRTLSDSYPVSQDCDFDGDGDVDSADAIYLLYAAMGIFDNYTLDGTIHRYYAPEWSWSEDETQVSAKFRCGCGEQVVLDMTSGVELKTVETESSCTAAGSLVKVAAVNFAGKEYSSTRTTVYEATGHSWEGQRTCSDGISCQFCGETQEALGHNWAVDAENSCPSTCSELGVQAYVCTRENCGATREEALEDYAEHKFSVFQEEQQVEGCRYQMVYVCESCEETSVGEVFYRHTYTAALTREATCSQVGVKTYSCTCGDSYTEEIPTNDSHSWDAGVVGEDGITTYTCTCGQTKTALVQQGSEATVSSTALAENELQLNGATVKMDEATVGDLGEEVKISVETVESTDLPITQEQLEQIGGSTVYDFNLFSDEDQISDFSGEVTITIPYTLQEGDDVDCIDVWFISDDGDVTCVQGTYSNGNVTFTTDHFSYYTVTRLTPAQRCEHYGHAMVTSHQDSTCTRAGHHVVSCQRCGYEEENETLALLEHTYEESAVTATCTQDGIFEKICTVCKQRVAGAVPALGHNWTEDTTQAVAATCTEAGKLVYVCANGCDESYEEAVPALGHRFGDVNVTEPNCTNMGSQAQTCETCGTVVTLEDLPALGHAFSGENAIWQWNQDYTQATVTLVCGNDDSHTKILNAVVTVTVDAPDCVSAGTRTYTAAVSYNKTTYTDSRSVELEVAGHQYEEGWQSNAGTHYHVCTVCGDKVDMASHIWGNSKVIQEADCRNNGKAESTCTVCGYAEESILKANGKHNYVDGVCTLCDFVKAECDHVRTYRQSVDLSQYDLCPGTEVWLVTCDCGLNNYYNYFLGYCTLSDQTIKEVEEDGVPHKVYVSECSKCGLVLEAAHYSKAVDKENCIGAYVEHTRILKGEDVVLNSESVYSPGTGEHMTYIPVRTIDMAELGMCGGELLVQKCWCGERTSTYFNSDLDCDWYLVSDENKTMVWRCDICGTTRTQADNTVRSEDCHYTGSIDYTYEKDGQVILTYSNHNDYIEHSFTVKDVELYGESCEDGFLMHEVCTFCGMENQFYAEDHYTNIREITDLTQYGMCEGAYVEKWSCPCGEYGGSNIWWEGCDMVYYGTTEDGSDQRICQTCNTESLHSTTFSEKDENCFTTVTENYKFLRDGKLLTAPTTESREIRHDMEMSLNLLGETCEDGVEVNRVCRDCGYVYTNTIYDHNSYCLATYDLSEYGLCGGTIEIYGCGCGQEGWMNREDDCSWNWVDGDDDWDSYECSDCDATRTVTYGTYEKIDECHRSRQVTYTYEKNGEELLKVSYNSNREYHAMVWSFTLNGETCDDGYRAEGVCQICGYKESTRGSGHGSYPVEYQRFSSDKLCGEIDSYRWTCPCGEREGYDWQWVGENCHYDGDYYLEAEDAWAQDCTVCGITRVNKHHREETEDPCVYYDVWNYSFRDGDTELFSFMERSRSTSHAWIYTFSMNGETCADGYNVSRVCSFCGYADDYEQYRDSCYSYRVERQVICDNEALCTPVYLDIYNCPCGDRYYEEIHTTCDWDWIDNDGTYEYYRCVSCGVEYSDYYHTANVEGTCDQTVTRKVTYTLNGEVIGQSDRQYTQKNHTYVASFRMDGETCYDGYYVDWTCVRCGKAGETDQYSYHNTFRTAYYDLSEIGTCGGYIQQWRCPCGQYSSWESSIRCQWNYTEEYDSETGLRKMECYNCGTQRYVGTIQEKDYVNCKDVGSFYAKFLKDQEVLLDVVGDYSQIDHTWLVDYYEFEDAEAGCDGDTIAHVKCHYCGNEETWHSGGHYAAPVEFLNLGETYPNTCGGAIFYDRCSCGKESNLDMELDCRNLKQTDSRSEEGADGRTHWFYEYSCSDCDLSYVREEYSIYDQENCLRYDYENYTFYAAEEIIKTYNTVDTWKSHTYGRNSGVLAEDSVTCEDGIIVTEICEICGYSYKHTTEDHRRFVVDTIDLTPYGSVCGGLLNHYSCPCGEYQSYDFADDSLCDVDQKSTDHWIDGVIDTYQYTSEGYQNTRSYAYTMTCAVTDPQCGMKIRMAEYWLKEGCEATEYQTWQLGYNAETGTWQEEFTVPTGYSHAYHAYTRTDINETLEDGTRVEGWIDTCDDCSSTYTRQYFYDENGNQIKYLEEGINTLDNGERKRYYWTYENGLQNAGYLYRTLERQENTYADGRGYWYQYAYAYDFASGCVRTSTYTNSEGDYDVFVGAAHKNYGKWTTTKEPTCSQFGEKVYTEGCNVCGEETYREIYPINPIAHEWYSAVGDGYYCGRCGLENSNGASGVIVVEELTEATGSDYVIGYWNREDVRFTHYVCVVLNDAEEGAEDELVLTDVTIRQLTVENDGVHAMAFDKVETQKAAEIAMATIGYRGDWDLRFTFVPLEGDDTLDYAITFDA